MSWVLRLSMTSRTLTAFGLALIEHGLDEPGPILAGASLGDLDVAASNQQVRLPQFSVADFGRPPNIKNKGEAIKLIASPVMP